MTPSIFENPNALAEAAAQYIAQGCQDAMNARGSFHIALAGGTTPQACYRKLLAMHIPWSAWHVYFGDERCFPIGHNERNDTMAFDSLLDHVPIPASQVHSIPAELGPEKAAEKYSESLQLVSELDIVLLGIGEDGHTASLFPGHETLDDDRFVVPVWNAPKPPPERVSMGLSCINAARKRLVLASGKNKKYALNQMRSDPALPISRLADSTLYLDKSAA